MVRTESAEPDDSRMACLMERYCGGEIAAFHELYAELAPRILGYLTGLAGDRPTAEDLLQQTFMKLHEARSAYARGANPVPWLYTIAHRTCLDELRRRKRARVRVSFDGNLPYEPSVDITGATDPQSAADEAAIARSLAALASLPPTLRQAVLLTKIHGHSSAEAASIAGTTASAIKVRAHRGYLALRQKLTRRSEPAPAVAGTP
jgi:RNA polymerase sigma-70 factor (ECF subfamily)